ncbi:MULTISPECIES: S41 family peptidase [unclassified Granulicatella]|uniref:S41 family peptidase n=1 Tax=unclassified Granulicatella TaxID=2630493 RepID=UPI001073EBFB|nr:MULTISPECIES: S41 family peptidase [unclassified Granulicatella]MBF0780575.1 S41 family peptidase [Granulicatella sp. 19428wC4_WM01]TFU94926.1 PDZ domain-containing protein [Granulicatella sp. WM01]
MLKNKKMITFSVSSFLGMIALTIILSVGLTYGVIQEKIDMNYSDETSSTQSALPSRLVKGLSKSYELMKKVYIGELDEDTLIDGALSGFVSAAGDKYTAYLNEKEWESLQQSTDGEFEGVGIEIEKSGDYIRIVSPYDNTPASKAGLRADDLIIGVDGEDIAGKSVNELAMKVRGKKGTSVSLKIRRGSSEFDVTLVRDSIPLNSVTHRLDDANKHIGIIRISSFAKTTYDELVEAITALRKEGATSFVIDVRSNPGGLLNSVEQIANMFVETGQVLYQMDNKKDGIQKSVANSSLGTFKVTEPVIVLVNNGSASAAEIFAAALSENNRATLVGTKTFGKGTAQSIFPLTDSTGIKITYSKWLTPNGEWIHEKGIEPQEVVELPEYATYNRVSLSSSEGTKLEENMQDVLNLQRVLNTLDYPVYLTGMIDEQTQAAIKTLQSSQQLEVTGALNEQTADVLNHLLAEKVKGNDTQLKKALELAK